MALSKSEITQFRETVERYLENHRPPRPMRGELDFRARITGQSVEIFRLHPGGRGRPGAISRDGVAKATYVKSRQTWKLYAQGQDLHWQRFAPEREFPSLEAVLKVLERNQEGRFYG